MSKGNGKAFDPFEIVLGEQLDKETAEHLTVGEGARQYLVAQQEELGFWSWALLPASPGSTGTWCCVLMMTEGKLDDRVEGYGWDPAEAAFKAVARLLDQIVENDDADEKIAAYEGRKATDGSEETD